MTVLTKALSRALYWICAVLFAVLVVVVVWQVVARQVLASPAAWTEETSRYIFVWLGLFAAALVFSERGHIAVDFGVRQLPRGAQRAVGILVQALIIVFALVILVYGGWRAAQGAWTQGLQALPFTLGQMYVVMPVTGALITYYALDNLLAVARGRHDPFPVEEEAEAAQYLDQSTGTSDDPGGPARTDEPRS